jgi:hypothetical protein
MVKRGKKGSNNYFTQETEDAIVLYNNTEDPELRSRIYEKHIHYPFFKLTQNIIHTFKFYHTEVDNLEHLQHEIETFLLSKLHLFNPERGAKAYSYFGTIVKRWCILYNNKNYKNKVNNSTIDQSNEDNLGHYTLDKNPDKDDLSNFIDIFVEYVTENIFDLFPRGNDAQIADAILELFRNRDHLTVFHKKALYIYIHEILPEVKSPKITKIANGLKKIFQSNYIFYTENGYIDFESN